MQKTPNWLQKYLVQLEENPLRTKSLTAGALTGAQEALAQVKVSLVKILSSLDGIRIIKMALYGLLISGPLGHTLYAALGRIIGGRKGPRWALLTLLLSNLIISPIQNAVFLSAMAIIAGKGTVGQVREAVQAGWLGMQKTSWVIFPLVQMSAIRYMPLDLWTPYFNLVAFVFGTYFNTQAKLRAVQSIRPEKKE
ncbi:hypothetical protein BJ684DRAFT_7407 [Piptocephalis cylindrospora]|uniref:Integral membrane protein n=1 Tax=Piptocephalis cylindrospora TaxID=1907219 RepID=A0A4P9YAQ4_9FUNG|nr:hypothetical protein BJ684DRAFT_7407 [Piptocephalis cylindrospora]|eukprot:RKP15180.1 hypothetical protein BJ684DRAFT_7407 [Piptocephalis cylindrospora]